MAIKTTAEQLEEVQASISRTLRAQETGDGDQRVIRARLDQLSARERVLLARYNAEQGRGGPCINTCIPKRR